jgi:hypothetical protein
MNKIESLGKLLPIGTLFIILCGAIKLIVYYRVFNIAIADFLEIGEYATLFVDDLLYYLTIFGAGILIYFISSTINKTSPETQNQIYPKSKKEKIWITSLAIITVIASTIIFFKVENYSTKLVVIHMGIYVLIMLSYIFALNTKFEFSYLTFIAFAIIFYSFMDGVVDGYKIIENNVKLKYEIILDDQKIKTNDKLHYVGKSAKYLFLYNIDIKTSTIIPMDKITEIKINVKEKL